MTSPRFHWLAGFAIIVAVAGLIRVIGLTREPVGVDEAFTAEFSSGETAQILESTARDIHPPLYYLGLAQWRRLAGDGIGAVRSFSVVWSLIGIGLLGLFARDLIGNRPAVCAVVVLAAVHPLDIYFAQTARMYSLLAALNTLACYLLWRWVGISDEEQPAAESLRWMILYTVTAVCMLHTHYLSAIFLVSQGFLAIAVFAWQRRWSSVAQLVGCAALTAVAFLPWMTRVLEDRNALYSSGHLSWIPQPGFADGASILVREFVSGRAPLVPPLTWLTPVVAAVVLVGLGALLIERSRTPSLRSFAGTFHLVYPAWLVAAPVALAIVVSHLYHPIYFPPRFAMIVLSPFLLLAGLAIDQIRRPRLRMGTVVVCALVLASATTIQTATISNTSVAEFIDLWQEYPRPDEIVIFPAYAEQLVSYSVGEPVASATRSEIEALISGREAARIWLCTARNWQPATDFERKFAEWLGGLGNQRLLLKTENFEIREIRLGD